MTYQKSSKKLASALSLAARSTSAMLLVSGILIVPSAPANASTTYAVPTDGLSFNADTTAETLPCTTGFANAISWSDPDDDWTETDEINGLKAGDSVTFANVATVGGQAIDARVTLTGISGMRVESELAGSPTVLDRLDKCGVTGADAGLLEVNFRSITALPGEASFELTIQFLASGSNATLTNLKMNVEDIDNNQFLQVDSFTSVRLADGRGASDVQEYRNGETIDVGGSPNPVLSTTGTARRFHALGSSSGSDGSTETDKHVVEVTYASVSSLVLKLGVYEAGGGSFDLNFRGFEFVSDTVTPAPSAPAPNATLAASPRLATTGTTEPTALGVLISMSALLVASGVFLINRRRKLG
jgi:hypothetical protein